MKITQIALAENRLFIQKKEQKQINKHNDTEKNTILPNTYIPYSVNFYGRTPENFYDQEVNRKYMPETMKQDLADDYKNRKSMPPEQLMNNSFKYLEIADDFSEVKDIYPQEALFANLHEANLKGRTGILSDIKLSKQLSEIPLFADGSDNFGMYLLKKIYLEGKTIKEINKDFYEKDLHSEYKGVITQPITYGTTSAYGIQYPKTNFWNSFIATRDDYKQFFVNIPKQSKEDLMQEAVVRKNKSKTIEQTDKTKYIKSYNRKYDIKPHQKKQLKKEIIKAKGNEESVKQIIRKQFGQNDPEASFLIKYMSPIMTIAADRIHLSEEIRFFVEQTKDKGVQIENLFAQFWKANPQLLEHYSTAIVDTMDLFEEVYADAGIIPINNEYIAITDDVENKKAIDFVSPQFLELLDFAQSIVPKREEKYLQHEKLQAEWDKHFLWRYGDAVNKQVEDATGEKTLQVRNKTSIDKQDKIDDDKSLELLQATAKKNNGESVYPVRCVDGNTVYVKANLDDVIRDYLKRIYFIMPPAFVNQITRKVLSHSMMTEDVKLSFAVDSIAYKLNDDRIIGKSERTYIMNYILSELVDDVGIAIMASLDTLASKIDEPFKVYISTNTKVPTDNTGSWNEKLLDSLKEDSTRQELNKTYNQYRQPLSSSEHAKITQIIMNYIRNFDEQFATSEKSLLMKETAMIAALKDMQQLLKTKTVVGSEIKKQLQTVLSKHTYSRALLEKCPSPEHYRTKCEYIACNILKDLILKNNKYKYRF